MGFAVGICLALDLRILGVAPGIQLAEFRRYVPILWTAFWLNLISGLLLLIGYPTKALTNPVFYLKLLLIGVGLVLFVRIGWRVFNEDGAPRRDVTPTLRRLAVISLVCWVGAITAGRFLAYTYSRLTALTDAARLPDLARHVHPRPLTGDRHDAHGVGLADRRECSLSRPVHAHRLRRLVRPAAAGVARRVPIAAMHRLIPFGILGFVMNIVERPALPPDRARSGHLQPVVPPQAVVPDHRRPQAGTFYLTSLPPGLWPGCSARRSGRAKVIAAISLGAWIGVIAVRAPAHLLSARRRVRLRRADCSCNAHRGRASGNKRNLRLASFSCYL